ncbi:MAG: oligosaccharide flippase family protein [Krumholzibacteria bacterium]|nr:oligosaccharide flippase family protein [Candidatus Krumholzibacteria bacterium]
MRGRAGIVRNLGVLSGSQAAAQLLNLAALVFLARVLGDRWFGVVQVGVAVSAYALITAEWGLLTLGVRELARLEQPARARAYARVHQGLLAVLAVVVLGLGLLILPRLPFYREDPLLFLLYLALVVPQVFAHEWIGIGMERMGWVGVSRIAGSAIYAGAVLLLLRPLDGAWGWPAWRWVPVFYLVSFAAGQAALALPVRRWLGGFVLPTVGPRAEWGRRLRDAAPIGASILTMRVLINGDLVLLGILATPAVAGQYAAPAKIGYLLVVAMEVLWKALLPRLSRLAAEPGGVFAARFRLYFGTVAVAVAPVAVGGVLLGPGLVRLVFGDQYTAGGPVLQVLAVSYSLLALGWFLGNSLLAADRQREIFLPLLVGAALVVGLGLVLIPRHGAVGAAVAVLAAHGALFGLTAVRCRRWFNRDLAGAGLPFLARAGLCAVAYAAAAGWPLRHWLRRLRDG